MFNSDHIIGVITLILAAVAYFATRDLSLLGGVFVDFTLWALVIFSVLEIIKGFVKPERINFFESKDEQHNIIVGLVILCVYLALLPFVGFLPSSLLFFAVMNLYLDEERLSRRGICKSVLLSVVVVAVFYLVFKQVLEVPLPQGSLFSS
jgi:amino acid transporter